MNVVAYMRYSTDKQTENSIEYQFAAIQKYCAANGHNILKTYQDCGYSGTNTNRPAFQELKQAAKLKLFDAVVIYDISRASRDIADWFEFRREMRLQNISVLSATQELGDTLNPDKFLLEMISAGLGQHQVLDTRKKSRDGVKIKAAQGAFLGGYPPYGYIVENGKYVVYEPEARVVRTIFRLYSEGESYNTILHTIGPIKGKRGKVIGKNSINVMLKNERYIGVYSWNTYTYKILRKWAGKIPNPEAVRIENFIPPIIDKVTWERTRTRMNDNKGKARNKAKREYLLSGLIECEKCGSTYVGHTSTNGKGYKTSYYVCGNKYRTHTCDAKNINADNLETFVVAQLQHYFNNIDFNEASESIARRINVTSVDLSSEKKELNNIETKIKNGVDAVLSGVKIPELEEELDRLRVRKSELEDIIIRNSGQKNVVDKNKLIKLFQESAQEMDTNIKSVIRNHVTKIYAHADGTVSVNIGVHIGNCGGPRTIICHTLSSLLYVSPQKGQR